MNGRHLDAAPDAMRTPPVPLADAARTLGCSRDALRKRIDRGTLRAVKRHGQWYVYLDAADATVDANTDATWTPPTGRLDAIVDAILDGADARWTPPDAAPDTPAAVLAEVCRQRDQLEAEVSHLRQQLDARTQAEAELRRIVAALVQQRALPSGALTAHAVSGDATACAVGGGNRDESLNLPAWWSPRRWAWWRR